MSFAKRLRGIAHEEDDEAMGAGGRLAWDDVTGVALDFVVVRCARLIETEFIHNKGVYTEISTTEAIRNDIRILRNVGGRKQGRHRQHQSQESFRRRGVNRIGGLFDSILPLEALKFLVSNSATIYATHSRMLRIFLW